MEARASLNGASVSRAFVAAILVIVALGLTAMGGYVAQSLSHSNAATQGQAYAAPGTVLRQDNPSLVIATSSNKDNELLKNVGYRGGATVVEPSQNPERSTGHKELP